MISSAISRPFLARLRTCPAEDGPFFGLVRLDELAQLIDDS